MGELGHFVLCFAWLTSLAGIILGVVSGIKKKASYAESARRAVIFTAIFSVLATIILAYQFLTDDYTNQYVWRYSNKDMFWVYKISSVWGGMDGSMLLWAAILSFSSGIVAFKSICCAL